MKINKEQLNKLKQNDRIEYLLRIDRLEKKSPKGFGSFSIFVSVVFTLFIGVSIFAVMATQFELGSIYNIYFVKIIAILGIITFKLIIPFFVLLCLLDLVLLIIKFIDWKREQKELNEKFFINIPKIRK